MTDAPTQQNGFGPWHEQAFPRLSPAEINRLRRFGEIRAYGDGDRLFAAVSDIKVFVGTAVTDLAGHETLGRVRWRGAEGGGPRRDVRTWCLLRGARTAGWPGSLRPSLPGAGQVQAATLDPDAVIMYDFKTGLCTEPDA